MKTYLVGGAVRDKIMGIQSKDLDYVCVLDSIEGKSVEEGYDEMREDLSSQGFEFFLETPEMFTIRAKFPKGHINEKQTGDFVLARKEVGYVENTRRPILELGTLYDDLSRRDARFNAIAMDEEGNYIDPFDGISDIKNKLISTPLRPLQTINDDALRILRYIRFSITKGFEIDAELSYEMKIYDYVNKFSVVSTERIREELLKCFKHNTPLTLDKLNYYSALKEYIFDNDLLWLMPTMKGK